MPSRPKGDLDNTLIIYTSDNGYFHGEHRIPAGEDETRSDRSVGRDAGPRIPQG